MHNQSIIGLNNFLNKCDELINAKFILADTKISELLGAIAASDKLFNLFEKVTQDFNYLQCKKVCLVQSNENSSRKMLLLPEGVKDKIAFVFCLLMEIDSKKLDFSSFLQTYFYADGSYFESFFEFCNQVIKPFKNTVKIAAEELYGEHLFAQQNGLNRPKGALVFQAEKYKKIKDTLNLAKEQVLSSFNIAPDEKIELCEFFDSFINAIITFDNKLVFSFLTGFKYITMQKESLQAHYDTIFETLNG